jgi:alkaline phosphatase
MSAIAVLERDPDGFVLLVENEHTDTLSHLAGRSQRDTDAVMPYLAAEVVALDETVEAIVAWIDEHPPADDTLLIVTADHETCGLAITPGAYVAGDVPAARCTAGGGHTKARVGLYARGRFSDLLAGPIENTDLFHVMRAALGPDRGEGSKI